MRFNLLPGHQSAYRANHSTETALLSLFDDLLTTADAGDASALLLLDLSAAFDTVDHGILLNRLSRYFGLSDSALAWFRSYLSGRTQSVQIENFTSSAASLPCGVPQGSVLGGPLFIMCVDPSPMLRPPMASLSGNFRTIHKHASDLPFFQISLRNSNAATLWPNGPSKQTSG